MITSKKREECCGCSACYAVCPVQAITMVADKEGFLYPTIDEERCIQCGKCDKVCSFHDEYAKAQEPVEQEYYAVIHKDEQIRKTSRSGGAFFALANAVFDKGGVVYGVMLEELRYAKTVRIEDREELSLLQGSKYVQSNKGDTFSLVKADLEADRSVLFSGTACEVSGLLSYLQHTKTDTSKLYTCDIICHGVPSPLAWVDNVNYIERKSGMKLTEVSFRDKKFGWFSHIESYGDGEKKVYANRYTSMFYKGVILRPCCGNCHYCNCQRCGDLTLADFWGVENMNLPIQTSKGVSALIVNTKNGRDLFGLVADRLEVYPAKRENLRQPNLISPRALPECRGQFWEDYERLGYKKGTDRYYSAEDRAKLAYNRLFRRKPK